MIHQLRLTHPSKDAHALDWASTVACLQAPVAFQPGLNILFGPNGSGKSTVLKLLAMALAAEQGGRSVVTTSWMQDLFGFRGDRKDELFWTVQHDGQPVVYSNPRQAIGLAGLGSAFDDDFMMDGLNELQVMKSSSGQMTSARIARVVRTIMDDPGPGTVRPPESPAGPDAQAGASTRRPKRASDFARKPASREHNPYVFPDAIEWRVAEGGFNDVWEARLKRVKALLQANGPAGPRTILMDEPESGFGLPWQAGFWHNVMRSAQAKNFQIIVATHSPFALNVPDAHYIETQPGYLEECRTTLTMEFGLPLLKTMTAARQKAASKNASSVPDASQDTPDEPAVR